MLREVFGPLREWLANGERVALATVVATRRSAPRPLGAKLAVRASGKMAGSVSGGCVENDVVENALAVLAGGEPRLLSYGISDDLALSVGLPCGGEIDVFVRELEPPIARRLVEVYEHDEDAILITVVDGDGAGAALLATNDGVRHGSAPADVAEAAAEMLSAGRSQLVELNDRRLFADAYGPPPRLLIYGAVDTADALCAAARTIGWRTVVADARARFATRERLPNADEILVAWPDEALEQVRPDHATGVVILTHDHKFDLPLIVGALSTDAFYIGALGSRRNQEERRMRLLQAGVEEIALERVFGPAGLDLGAQTPAETALSILAEVVATRGGSEGGPLRAATTRIHAAVA